MAGNVLIDVTRLLSRALEGRLATGVDRVALAYVAHFRERACALVRYGGRWVVLDQADSHRVFAALLEPGKGWASVVRWCVGRGYLFSWGRRQFSFLLNNGHSGLDDANYAGEVARRGLNAVYSLHDLIPITHPEYCRPGEADKHRRRVATMLEGRGLILCSEASLRSLEEYAAENGLRVPPCVVAPLAPAALPAPSVERPLMQPYFVVLGTIEPRKNHLLLLQVWRQIVEEMGELAPKLVVIGQRGWECEQVVDLLERSAALKGHVIEHARCTDAELASWLMHAQALLFPSFVEGYGMPLVEALALDTPVIASDLPVFRELAGAVPEYLDPLDGPGWKRAILEYAQEGSPMYHKQLERMRSHLPSTWEQHFERVDGFLTSLAADG